jgi:hypothetical protein
MRLLAVKGASREGLLSGVPYEAARHSFPLRQVSQPPSLGRHACHEIFKSGRKWEVSRRKLGCELNSFRTAPFNCFSTGVRKWREWSDKRYSRIS